MKNFLKKTGWVDILVSVIFAVIGIFMIINPDSALEILSYILGGIFILIGIVKLIDYFASKGKYDFYNYDLVFGVIAIVIGIVTIFCSGLIESMFRIIIGLWIIYSGLMRLSLSLKLHAAKVNTWGLSLAFSIIMIIGGICMIFQSGALMTLAGIIMLIYSVMDLVENIIFVKYVDKLL